MFSLPHTSNKHGNRQADGGGQGSHIESLTENIRNGYREWGVGGVLLNTLCISFVHNNESNG
jgi:hypothetical protein